MFTAIQREELKKLEGEILDCRKNILSEIHNLSQNLETPNTDYSDKIIALSLRLLELDQRRVGILLSERRNRKSNLQLLVFT